MTNSMRTACRRVAIVGIALCLALTSGCGLVLELTATPNRVAPGGTVEFGIRATNPSQCPFGDVDLLLIPFVTIDDLEVHGDEELVDFFQLFIGFCNGQGVPEDVECRFEDEELICDLVIDSAAQSGSGTGVVRSPAGPLLVCEREGGRVACRRPSADDGELGGAALFPLGLSCVPAAGAINCVAPLIQPGATLDTNVLLSAPTTHGSYYSLLIGGAWERGICKDTGETCSSGTDCPGGTEDMCAPGICIDGQTGAQGLGCEDNSECPTGSACVICTPDNGVAPLPVTCVATQVQPPTAAAPTLSPWAIAAAVLMLIAQAYYLRRRRA